MADHLKLNLVKIDPDDAIVMGRDLAIKTRDEGLVYVTTKPYIDKLFKLMGYKSLGVIKILEDYADKTVSEIGNLGDYTLWVDNVTDSFVIAKEEHIRWIKELYDTLEKNNFEVLEYRRYDTCYLWDQLTVKSPTGTCYALYVDICDEAIYCLSLDYDPSNGQLCGMIDEGKYLFEDGTDSLNSLMVLMMNPVDISPEFTRDQKLSIYEYVNLLISLGYVGKKKKKVYATDNAEEVMDLVGNLEAILEEYNCCSWLQLRIRETPNQATFEDACQLISLNLDECDFWKFRDFFMDNARERSDFFALNY